MAHIGIDARLTYYRAFGGTTTYIRSLLRALEQTDTVNRYTVFRSRKSSGPLVDRFTQAALWTPCHHRIERTALSVELARFGLDVLHSPDFIPPRRGARRHVITVHDLAFLLYPDHMTADSLRYYNAQIQQAVKRADHILAVSAATKQDIMRLLGVPEDKITVQHHGIEPQFKPLPDSQRESLRETLKLPPRFLLFVGTFEPRKNIPTLLDAYQLLRDTRKDTPPLVMVGRKGWLIDDTYTRMKNTAGVIIREDIDDSAQAAVYGLASALILPAHYEGFGMPALEAMACGTLPIVSDRASLPEIVGNAGLLIDPDAPESIAQAVTQILDADEVWLSQQRQRALNRASQFTWEQSARIARSVYEAVLR